MLAGWPPLPVDPITDPVVPDDIFPGGGGPLPLPVHPISNPITLPIDPSPAVELSADFVSLNLGHELVDLSEFWEFYSNLELERSLTLGENIPGHDDLSNKLTYSDGEIGLIAFIWRGFPKSPNPSNSHDWV